MKYTNVERSAERRIDIAIAKSFDMSGPARLRVRVTTGFGTPAMGEWVTFRVFGENGTAAGWAPSTLPLQGGIVPLMSRGAVASGVGPDQSWAEFTAQPNGQGYIDVLLSHVGAGGVRQVMIMAGSARYTLPNGITL